MSVNLILAVLCMSALYVILKFFEQWKVDNLHGLLFNYITASALSFCISFQYNVENISTVKNFLTAIILIGLLFMVVFYITAKTAQVAGVGVATVASKMSVVIPVVFGIYLYDESLGAKKVIGVLIALVSVYLTSTQSKGGTKGEGRGVREKIKEETGTENKSSLLKSVLLPALLFIGAGIVDTSIKYSQHTYINDNNNSLFVSSLFGSAALFGLIRTITTREKITFRSVAAGVFLGVCNFFSLFFLLKCLAVDGADSGLVFTLINIGVVIVSVIASFFFFAERPTKKGIAGIALALVAIYFLL